MLNPTGGIVAEPVQNRKKFLHPWRLTPLIGKWALFLKNLYTEITYRPGNLGAECAALEFQAYMQQY